MILTYQKNLGIIDRQLKLAGVMSWRAEQVNESQVGARAVIDMQFMLTCHGYMRKSANVRHRKYFTTYIDMLFQSNGTWKYLRNKEIMSNFSRDTTIVAFCRPSFILWSQCAQYFRVCTICSISRLFLCAMIIFKKKKFQWCSHRKKESGIAYCTIVLTVANGSLHVYEISCRIICQHFWT